MGSGLRNIHALVGPSKPREVHALETKTCGFIDYLRIITEYSHFSRKVLASLKFVLNIFCLTLRKLYSRSLLFALLFVVVLLLQQNFMPAVKACDPSNPNYAYYGTNYTLKITSLTTDKTSYSPGDTVTISGTLTLEAQDVYYSSDCNEYSYGDPYTADPTGVAISLSPSGSTTSVAAGGSFGFTVKLSDTVAGGSYSFTATATHESSGATDSASVDYTVASYTPQISVTGTGPYYPGDTIVFAGAGWIPNQAVTVKFLGLQAQETGPTFSDQFVVPDNAAEGTLNILGNQDPNLQATTTVTIQWRPLTVNLASQGSSFQEGSTVTVAGTVTSNNGPVQDASVAVTYHDYGGTVSATGTTGADGSFTVSLTAPTGAWAFYEYSIHHGGIPDHPTGTISATATKSPGYKSPSNTATYAAPVQYPSDLTGEIVDLATFPAAGVFTVSLGATVATAEAAGGAYIFSGAATAGVSYVAFLASSLAFPVTVLVVSGGVLVGAFYYRYRNPPPDNRPVYAGAVRG